MKLSSHPERCRVALFTSPSSLGPEAQTVDIPSTILLLRWLREGCSLGSSLNSLNLLVHSVFTSILLFTGVGGNVERKRRGRGRKEGGGNEERKGGREDLRLIHTLSLVGYTARKTTLPKPLCSLGRFGQWAAIMGNWRVGGEENPRYLYLCLCFLWHLQQ